MSEWLSLLIPIIITALFYFKFKNKFAWWEPSMPILAGIIIILSLKSCGKEIATIDTEYYNYYVERVERDERWQEDIECSEDCFCVETCDTDGENCTETCQTCYYDCPEWHEECYRAVLNTNDKVKLTKEEYYYYVNLFGTGEKFKDLNRTNYYENNDGDRYICYFDNDYDKIQYHTKKHTYKNKVQASHSVFNYPEVSEEDIKLYDLYEYPNLYEENGLTKQKHLIGYYHPAANRELEKLNALLGSKKQLNTYILVWEDHDKMSANMQEWYWKGGNKNEFIICLGIKARSVDWVKIISWTENFELKNNVRNYVLDNSKNFNFVKLIDYLKIELDEKFERKEFSDFDYLEIEIPTGWLITIYILMFLSSIVINLISVKNDIE